MSWLDTPSLDRIEHYVNLSAFREELVAGNIANVDTPHYRTVDIDFKNELRHALTGAGEEVLKPKVQEVKGLIERPDGNNVSMDREGMLLAETQLQFRVGVQLLREQYHMLLAAINEGK
jgi:flagellar basal-body rod protein FlgB